MACFFKKKVLLSNTFPYWSFFRQYSIPKKNLKKVYIHLKPTNKPISSKLLFYISATSSGYTAINLFLMKITKKVHLPR